MPPKFFFSHCNEPIWLAQHFFYKNKKLWRLPKIEASTLKYGVPPLWPTYVGEKRTTFAKAYGIKVRCYEKHVGEHIGNLVNILGTGDFFIKNLPPPPTEKEKKARHLECMLGPSHWLHEISLSKRVCHHFWPRLICLAKNTLPITLPQINSGYNASPKFKPDPVFVMWNTISKKRVYIVGIGWPARKLVPW